MLLPGSTQFQSCKNAVKTLPLFPKLFIQFKIHIGLYNRSNNKLIIFISTLSHTYNVNHDILTILDFTFGHLLQIVQC